MRSVDLYMCFCMYVLWRLEFLEICWMLIFMILSWIAVLDVPWVGQKILKRVWLNNVNVKISPTNSLAAYVLHNLLAHFQTWTEDKIA